MKVGLLTTEQKQELVGSKYEDGSYFNPVQDTQGNWVISTVEIDLCVNVNFMWVKELPLIDWTGPYIE